MTHKSALRVSSRCRNFLARRQGGQGVVQFMKRARDGVEFAVKFFYDLDGALTRLLANSNTKARSLRPAAIAMTSCAQRCKSCCWAVSAAYSYKLY